LNFLQQRIEPALQRGEPLFGVAATFSSWGRRKGRKGLWGSRKHVSEPFPLGRASIALLVIL
jgi:hypothetical protein